MSSIPPNTNGSTPVIAGNEVGLPERSEAVNAKWIQAVLRRSGGIKDDVIVSSVVTERFTGGGLACASYKLKVTYETGSGPTSLFMKMPLDVAKQRSLAEAFGIYRKETKWYRDIAPFSRIHTPKVYAAMVNDESTHFCLVMEDLSNLNHLDPKKGLLFDYALRVIDALAAYHSTWTDSDKLGELRKVFFGFDHPVYVHGLPTLHDSGWEAAKKYVPETLTPESLALGDEWKSHLSMFIERLMQAPLTLSHGDPKAENIFFDDENNRVFFVDPQLAGVQNVAYDLAIIVGLSMEHEEYKGRAEELVKRYVDVSLREHNVKLDYNKMMSDMKLTLGLTLFYGFASFGSYEEFTEPMKEATTTFMRRISTAITEFDVLSEVRKLNSSI